MKSPTTKTGMPPGKASLFRRKVRAPVSITLTPGHHEKVNRNMKRLALSRSDLIGLLIDRFADVVDSVGCEQESDRDDL